jgi:hypothetical protein
MFEVRSSKYFQNEMPSLRQVFFKLVKVSRHFRPESLRVLLLIFFFFTIDNGQLIFKTGIFLLTPASKSGDFGS